MPLAWENLSGADMQHFLYRLLRARRKRPSRRRAIDQRDELAPSDAENGPLPLSTPDDFRLAIFPAFIPVWRPKT
jgi:hypothetical protein